MWNWWGNGFSWRKAVRHMHQWPIHWCERQSQTNCCCYICICIFHTTNFSLFLLNSPLLFQTLRVCRIDGFFARCGTLINRNRLFYFQCCSLSLPFYVKLEARISPWDSIIKPSDHKFIENTIIRMEKYVSKKSNKTKPNKTKMGSHIHTWKIWTTLSLHACAHV